MSIIKTFVFLSIYEKHGVTHPRSEISQIPTAGMLGYQEEGPTMCKVVLKCPVLFRPSHINSWGNSVGRLLWK